MRRAFWLLVAVLAAAPCQARITSRSYICFNGGPNYLLGDTSGDVIDSPLTGIIELGVGYELSKKALLEFTYGWGGTFQQEGSYYPLNPGELPSDTERAFKVALNPLFLRLHYVPGGARTEYFKPEFGVGLGFIQVSRLLRNIASVPPQDTSQLLASVELGVAGLLVFSKNFMGNFGLRYTFTERRGIVDNLDNVDGVALLIGFRVFLPSPRDMEEP